MAQEYMDYGQIVQPRGSSAVNIKQPINNKRVTQVYNLTHEGAGNSRSFIEKAFISFTYGGKKIEDFGLIVVNVDDRIHTESPPEHQDHITQYNILNGQYYWGSHYNAREMSLSLATDGMTQQQLDDFKYWFQGGEIRQLIMSEHPNRAIMARVSEKPEISVIPFQRQQIISIDNIQQEIIITEYKGSIDLIFVMDDPFWYAKKDILGALIVNNNGDTVFTDRWINANNQEVTTLDGDAYKVVIQDRIPTASMVQSSNNFNFGNNLYLREYNPYKYTLSENINDRENLDWQFDFGEDNNQQYDYSPLVNDENDIRYPLSGAVVGKIYQRIWQEDEMITSQLLANLWIQNLGITSEDGSLESKSSNYFSIKQYIPIKNGSSITFNNNSGDYNLYIAFYKKQQSYNQYIFQFGENINNSNKFYEFTDDYYIRLCLFLEGTDLVTNFITNFKLDNFQFNCKTFAQDSDSEQLNILNNENYLSYFYSGNAVSYPTIKFKIPIQFDDNGYIKTFNNKFINSDYEYNVINLQSEFNHQLKITNPSIFTSYNEVIAKLRDENWNPPYITAIEQFRNTISHPAVRSWIINCINVYFNNYNQNQRTINQISDLNEEIKQILLNYMKYFFVSAEDINYEGMEGEPETISISSVDISNESYEFVQTFPMRHSIRLSENNNSEETENELNLIAINIADYILNDKFEVTVNAPTEFYFQWQYTTDTTFNKWYLMYDEDGWTGSNTRTLTCNEITSENCKTYLRCIVSNNNSYNKTSLTSIIQLNLFQNTLNITNVQDSSNKTDINNFEAKQKNNYTITWTIQGTYINIGQEYENEDYSPQLLILPSGSSQWQSIKYGTTNKSVVKACNNQLEKIWLNQNNSKIVFHCYINENDNKQLRGAKIKLRLLKLNAESPDTDNSNQYVESIVTINKIIRLQKTNEFKIELKYGLNLQNSINSFSTNIGLRPGTEFQLQVSGLLNIKSGYFERKRFTATTWEQITNGVTVNSVSGTYAVTIPDINTNGTDQQNEWRINQSTDGGYDIRFIAVGVQGDNYKQIFPDDGTNIHIYVKTITELNENLQNYSLSDDQLKIKYISVPTSIYTDDPSFKIKIGHKIGFPDCVQTCNITYKLYKNNSDDSLTLIAQQTYENLTALDQTFYSHEFTITNFDTTAVSLLYTGKIDLTLNGTGTSRTFNFNNTNPVSCNAISIYQKITSITVNTLGFSNYSYYSLENNGAGLIENNSGQPITNYQQIITYTIVGDHSNVVWYHVSSSGALQNSVESTFFENKLTQSEENNSVIYSCTLNFDTAAAFYNNLNNNQYYITVKQLGMIQQPSVSIPQVTFSFNQARDYKILDISLNELSFPTQISDITWNWPTGKVESNKLGTFYKEGTTTKLNIQQNDIISQFEWNTNHQLKMSGVFPKTEFHADEITTSINLMVQMAFSGTVKDGYCPYRDPIFIAMAKTGGTFLTPYETSSLLAAAYNANNNVNAIREILDLSNLINRYSSLNITFALDNYNPNYTYKLTINNNEQSFTANNLSITFNSISLDNISELKVNMEVRYTGRWGNQGEQNSNVSWSYGNNTITTLNNTGSTNAFVPKNNTIFYRTPNATNTTISYSFKSTQFNSIRIQGENNEYPLLSITKIQGVPKSVSSSGGAMLLNAPKSSMRKGGLLRSNDSFTNPVPKQLCPIVFNNLTGEYTMQVRYNTILWPNGLITDNNDLSNPAAICQVSSLRHKQSQTTTESVGDMILSNKLCFMQQNHFNQNNKLEQWKIQDKTLCHKVTYDGDTPLQNFNIQYKNLYL